MKIVIDSNQLQTRELREFLKKSSSNFAVLPDFAAMEAYKGDTLRTIFKSMEVLSDFPAQVVVLKGSAKNFAMNGKVKGLQRRLIDEVQTREFPEYIRALRLAQSGNTRLQAQILKLGESANEHLEKMRIEALNIREAIQTLGSNFSKEERGLLRARDEYTPELIDKLVRTVLELAAMIFQDSPLIRKTPTYPELPNTFVFRVTLACYLLGIKRFANGGFSELSAAKLRNDFVDMMFVAYGTFFDGLMSSDKNVNAMFEEVRLLLAGLFDAEIPSLTYSGVSTDKY